MRALPTLLAAILIVGALFVSGCGLFEEDRVRGCTDERALNHDYGSNEDDGSCAYSQVIFYRAADGPAVAVTVDTHPIGIIRDFDPSGPGDCSAPGGLTYQLEDGDRHRWRAETLQSRLSGIIQAKPTTPCMYIKVF